MIKQIDAVIEAVVKFQPSFQLYKDVGRFIISANTRKQIAEVIVQGILDNKIKYDKSTANINELKKYVAGMISNHIVRNKALNGNVPLHLIPKRDVITDPCLTALTALQKNQVDKEIIDKINSYIQMRTQAIQNSKCE